LGGSYKIGTDASTWGDYIDLNNRNFTSEYWRTRLDNTWNKAYALIRNCNTILEKMEGRKEIFTGNNYNMIRGEALALRALLHFDMFRLFGPVYKLNPDKNSIPYETSTTLQVQELLPGTEVMQHVIDDLTEAETLLADDPIITTKEPLVSHNATGDNFQDYRTLRLNYYAVQALLARAYYYISSYAGEHQQEYKEKARAYAEGIINIAPQHFPFVDKANILGTPENVDRIFASEVIFGLTNVNRNLLFKNNNDPDRSPKPVLIMDPALLEMPYFGGGADYGGSTDDYRYIANWKKSGSDYYFYKYADITDVGKI
ncbi:MAG: RagB/SusD family nutrient uptake outer membrane protein, partial [Paraprevotella sp.]|nr:RagB/SusD family nutrient uptake outer membrane protein [Paraprevotella sp.]